MPKGIQLGLSHWRVLIFPFLPRKKTVPLLLESQLRHSDVTWTPRWWQLKYFWNFHPYLGKISNLTNIFQMGWNHQPVFTRHTHFNYNTDVNRSLTKGPKNIPKRNEFRLLQKFILRHVFPQTTSLFQQFFGEKARNIWNKKRIRSRFTMFTPWNKASENPWKSMVWIRWFISFWGKFWPIFRCIHSLASYQGGYRSGPVLCFMFFPLHPRSLTVRSWKVTRHQ